MVTLLRSIALPLVILIALGITAYLKLKDSLPILDGFQTVTGISDVIYIDRDQLGIPTIKGKNRADVAYATGYVHAQDRFFQMDLNRRNASGELSELVGAVALPHDKKQRKHRFRQVARQVVKGLKAEEKALLDAYVNGVNQGIQSLLSKPLEYWLLNTKPAAWQAEDSILTVFSMYLDLNDNEASLDQAKGFLNRVTSSSVIDFLSPLNTRWDSPLRPGDYTLPSVPSSEQVNLRQDTDRIVKTAEDTLNDEVMYGSNSWAVSGDLTVYGSALLEVDMHLNLGVPNTWYRAQFRYPHPDDTDTTLTVTGITLPGAPVMVAGSNETVSWGFTNSYGDWVDLVELHLGEDGYYMTPEGPEKLARWTETIKVKGQNSVQVEYVGTRWGPVVESQYDGHQYALRWTAHDPEATNMNILKLETTESIHGAMEVANSAGMPPQNFVVGDHNGDIAWTIAGRVPSRNGSDTTYPLPWQYADSHWLMWLSVSEYPRVINPENDRIWTANARVASGLDYEKLGNGGYALGPRQKQIRDQLLALESADEDAFLKIALDDRALYMENWRQLALGVLQGKVSEERNTFMLLIQNWSGQASVDDTGYRLVREFHDQVRKKVLQSIGQYFLSLSPEIKENIQSVWLQDLNHNEAAVLRLLEEQPLHWLSSKYSSWDELMLESIDDVILRLGGTSGMQNANWGQRNTSSINHPLSASIPVFGSLLNMSEVPLAGDLWMPRSQKPSSGVSQRMVVAPGSEESGIFHMPGGQSGHPLSSFYRAGYKDWAEGQPSSFLPDKFEHRLIFVPVPD